jgi:Tfp pilus assembly protein PilV
VTAAAVIDPRRGRVGRLVAKLRAEDGIGLIELLIAILVLNIGIFATIGAFTSAATTIRRASRISTAAAIADQTVESLHNLKYSNIVGYTSLATNTTGADGLTYNVQVVVSSGQVTGGSANLEQAIVKVRQGAAGAGGAPSGTLLTQSTTTFSRCAQSGVQSDSGQAPCYS